MCAFRPHCPISTGGFHFRTAKTPPPRPLAPCPRLPALSYAVRVINTTKNHTRRRAVPTVRKPCRQSRRRAHPFAVRKPCRRVRKICRVRSADGDRRRGNRADRFGNGHGFGAVRATMPPNAPQPPAVAFPPFGRVRARPDLPPRPVCRSCAPWRQFADGDRATGSDGDRFGAFRSADGVTGATVPASDLPRTVRGRSRVRTGKQGDGFGRATAAPDLPTVTGSPPCRRRSRRENKVCLQPPHLPAPNVSTVAG